MDVSSAKDEGKEEDEKQFAAQNDRDPVSSNVSSDDVLRQARVTKFTMYVVMISSPYTSSWRGTDVAL